MPNKMLNSTNGDEKKFIPQMSTYSTISKSSAVNKPASNIFDGQYFEIVLKEADTLVVRCNICGPDGPQLRSSTKSNGNILKHIQRRHAALLDTIKTEKNIRSRMTINERRRLKRNSSVTIKQERKSFHLPSNSQQLEITYSDGIVVPESDINSTEDDLNDDTDMMSEELLVESGKNEEYQVNQEPEIEEAILDDRNYNSFNKSGHVDIFDQDLAYDQNGQELRTPQSSQPHSNQSSIRQQHFVSSVLNSNERLRYDKELVDFQKELMQKEFDEVRAMRQAKHKLEMQILTAELKHKFIEHQKQLEILNKRVLQDM